MTHALQHSLILQAIIGNKEINLGTTTYTCTLIYHTHRTVLASQEFKTFTTTANLLTWAVGVNTEEGVRVSYILRENTYPFLALIVLKQSRMVVCDRVEGTVEKAPLMRRLEAAIRNNEGELVVERNERCVWALPLSLDH